MKRGFRVAQSNCNDGKKYRKSKKRKNLKIKVLSGLLAAMVCASGVWYAFYRNGWEFELPWAAERKYALLDSGITNEATGIQVKYSTVGKTDNKNEDSALESKDVSGVELPYAAEYFSSFLTEEEQTVCRQLYKGFREFQTDIDITDGVIESEDICSFIVLCTSCAPEFSYIGQEYSVTLDSSGYVMSVEVSYTMTAEEAAAQQAEIDVRAEELIAGMESDWDDYEKFRYIHDNLILSCQYKENEGSCYTAYGCLVEGEAVCEGYAKAMLTLCEKVGIGCVPVVGLGYENGEPLPHIWNKVLIDGEWYCTDPTWDDPVSQMGEDYIRYDYFAITDKQMNLDHTADENKKTDTSSDLAYVKDKGTLVIGITLFAPMDYYEEGNTTDLKGFEADFARAVCEKLGVTPTFQVISWEAKESELNSKNVDCLWNGLTITDARKNTMSISTPYMANKQVLITKSENADKYSSAGSLKGATVVAEKESAGEEVATSDAFFEGANYTAVDSMAKAIMEVSSGTADAAVIDYVTGIGSIGEGTNYTNIVMVSGANFADEEYGIAFRKDSDITPEVNKAIDELAKDGTLRTIAEKYKLGGQLLVG